MLCVFARIFCMILWDVLYSVVVMSGGSDTRFCQLFEWINFLIGWFGLDIDKVMFFAIWISVGWLVGFRLIDLVYAGFGWWAVLNFESGLIVMGFLGNVCSCSGLRPFLAPAISRLIWYQALVSMLVYSFQEQKRPLWSALGLGWWLYWMGWDVHLAKWCWWRSGQQARFFDSLSFNTLCPNDIFYGNKW